MDFPTMFYFHYYARGETLAQVVQRGGGCPVAGNIQGQTGCASEKPDLVEDVLGHRRRFRLDEL